VEGYETERDGDVQKGRDQPSWVFAVKDDSSNPPSGEKQPGSGISKADPLRYHDDGGLPDEQVEEDAVLCVERTETGLRLLSPILGLQCLRID
jgi:hypothetical protein